MQKTKWSFKITEHAVLWGIVLGFGAPAGWFLVRMIIGAINGHGIVWEFKEYSLWYAYLTIGTVGAFVFFGYILGRNIKLLKQAEQIAVENSFTDELTALKNRRYFDQILLHSLYRFKRYKLSFVLVSMDIDFFKTINDWYGHLVGDQVLKSLAQILKQSIREVDHLSRYGGDEFMMILNECMSQQADEIIYRIKTKFHEQCIVAHFPVTLSIGYTMPQTGDSLDIILNRVDHALYDSKHKGGDYITAVS